MLLKISENRYIVLSELNIYRFEGISLLSMNGSANHFYNPFVIIKVHCCVSKLRPCCKNTFIKVKKEKKKLSKIPPHSNCMSPTAVHPMEEENEWLENIFSEIL